MKKILLLFGGNSFEHEISCKSARNIIDNIDTKKYDLSVCGLDKDNNFYIFNDSVCYLSGDEWLSSEIERVDNPILYMKEFDKVFPIIHGNSGEDGRIISLLELYNIPYVGSNSLSSGIAYNKYYTKKILDCFDIPQVDYEILYKEDKVNTSIEYPVIIKPTECGSSIGINIANNKKELIKYVKEAFKYSDSVIIEKYIKKRELECSILESKNKLIVSPVGEILPLNGFYDYNSKYEKDTKLSIPADINKELMRNIQEYAKKIFKILSLHTYARLDFMYDYNRQKLYFNEVNTIPGFTDISMFPKVFEYMGISMKNLITLLIEN